MKYRGIELPAQYAHLVKNIDSLNNLIDDIKDLQSSWDSLSLLGELTQVGSEITTTRQHFKTLSERLGCSLVKQSVQDVLQSLESQAQHAIDILVRNLFERTADIGFLATDLPLTQALCQPPCPAVAQRMHSYVSKYSVYRNLALIKPDGTLHQDLRGEYSEQDKACWLIDAVQRSTKPYVERHGPLLDKDARASKDMGLIYAWKVEQGKRLVGYVALEFDLQGESETLFSKVLGHNQTGAAEGTELNWAVCGIVDSAYRVLSSSDTHHVPPGLQLKWPSNTHWGVIQIGPMAYLGSLRSTRGYQGYQGPGWMGFSLMPINQAFAPRALSQHSQTPRHIELRASLLGEEVIDHQRQAEHIQGRLNRSVWNGNIQQRESSLGLGSGFSKTLLWEISRAGERTRQLFEHTLSELNDRTIALELIEQRHCAMLAVDLLDRNLYERANDCRWWADTPILANCLANPSDSATLKASQDCLQHINSLYTVYIKNITVNKKRFSQNNTSQNCSKGCRINVTRNKNHLYIFINNRANSFTDLADGCQQ